MQSAFQYSRFSLRAARVLVTLLLAGAGNVRAQQVETSAQIGTQQDVMRRSDEQVTEQQLQLRLSDPELGEIDLVSRAPKPKMFTFSTDETFLYTSNAFLLPNREMDDVFWNGRFNASWVPYATRQFTPRLTFEQNFFRYDEFSRLDFDSQALQLDLMYDFSRNHSLFGNLTFTGTRLDAPRDDMGEFYTYGLFNASLTDVRQLGQGPLQLVTSLGGGARVGDPGAFDRATGYLNVVLAYSPTETVQLLAFVHPELQFYLRDPLPGSRKDVNFSVGATAAWTPIQYFTIGTTVAFTHNDSTKDVVDYDVVVPSVFLTGRFSF
jgi:hypothetical protein